MNLEELVGKYLNGYRIAKVEKDPFIKGQINLWTDETKFNFLSDREVIKFYVRDYPSNASIYQEQVDKENKQLKSQLQQKENIIKEVREYIMSELISDYDIKYGGCVSGSDLPVSAITPILEILDKENK